MVRRIRRQFASGAIVLALLLAPAVVGCAAATPSERLEELYQDTLAEPGEGLDHDDLMDLEGERAGWVEEVLAFHRGDKLRTERDLLIAATILLDSPRVEDLDLARDLALEATERGDDRGYPLAAEAIDRGLMLRGLPQRYGTQYVYLEAHGWVLYRWDQETTDLERELMGVPSLEEALERIKTLNGVE